MVRQFLSDFFSDTGIPEDLNPFLSQPVDSEPREQESNDPEITDDFVFKIDKVTGEDPYSINEEDRIVVIDPERGDWDDSKGELKNFWVENKRVFSESAFELYLSIQANKGQVNEVCEYFDGILSSDQYEMLKQAYHTSIYFNTFRVPKGKKDRRRGQLADRFGHEAMNVPSLCSAGYFEENKVFRKAYSNLPDEESKNEVYQDLFDELIRKRPFVKFVRGTDTVTEVYDLLIQKSRHLDGLDIDIDYIHIRGIGKYSQEKISEVLRMLDQHHPDIKYVPDTHRKESGLTELVVAIDNDSI